MRESQKILANILAAEDITLVEKNTDTASFNTENRMVTMPNWVSLNYGDDVFNMFLGHEVSHALYTPTDSWNDVPKNIPRSYVNVVEDIRIEKMIKRTYMGLIPIFRKAYSEIAKDFFKGFNGNKSKFIDRINVYFKCGDIYDIFFSEKEQVIVDGLKTVETWDDVLHYAKLLKDWYDDNEQDCIGDDTDSTSTNSDNKEQEGSTEFEKTPMSQEDDSSGDEDQDEEISDEQDEGPEPNNDSEDNSEESLGNDEGDSDGEDTDESDSEEINEDDYVVDTIKSSEEFMKNELDSVGDIVIPYEESDSICLNSTDFYDEIIELHSSDHFSYPINEKVTKILSSESELLGECKKDANIMYSEFMRKKAAKVNLNATQATSGVIDVNQLHSYKVNDNIFLSKAILPEGQNHGVAIMLDISGSMRDIMVPVLQQVITIVMFCKKANIPFEVYMYAQSVHHIFHSGQSKSEYETILAVLLSNLKYNDTILYMPSSVRRYRTESFTALYNMYATVNRMKVKQNLDIVNTMLFTDGASHKAELAVIDNPTKPISKYSLQGNNDNHRVTLQMEFAKKNRTVDITSMYGNEINKAMMDTVLNEFKKLGNMIYVYCPTYNSSGLYSQVLHLSNELKTVCDYTELSKNTKNISKEEYKKKDIADISYLFKNVSSCIVISKKVFKSKSSYDTITTNSNFDSTKDGQIVKAINAKTKELKHRKTLVGIFASRIAEAII